MITCQIEGAWAITPSAASMYSAGMVNTAPETTCEEFAPTDCTITFSRIVLLRFESCENPMPRMAMGMAASMPWPSFSAT